MPTIKTKLDRFDGGIANDPRDPRENTCRAVTNFDIFTNPRKMTPYRSSEDGHSGASTLQPLNFCIAKRSGSGTSEVFALFALSRLSGSDVVGIQMKFLTTGAATDLDDNGWDTPSNNEGSTATRYGNLFVYYRKTDRIYGAHGGTALFSFDLFFIIPIKSLINLSLSNFITTSTL